MTRMRSHFAVTTSLKERKNAIAASAIFSATIRVAMQVVQTVIPSLKLLSRTLAL